jgi:methionine-rich copper-binding protein CopC
MRSLGIAFVVAAAIVSMTTRADAHAHYRTSVPADNGVADAPHELRIDFTEGVEPAFSHVTLADAAGHPVPVGPLATAGGDASELIVPVRGAMRAGRYQVTWAVTSVDTHRTQGSYSFTVGR